MLLRALIITTVAIAAGFGFRAFLDDVDNDGVVLFVVVSAFWAGYFAKSKLL